MERTFGRILLVTDAWEPQVNGVVQSLKSVQKELIRRELQVDVLSPETFITVPCPTYPEIPLAVLAEFEMSSKVTLNDYDAIHIATEGPLGLAIRRQCLRRRLRFTTAYHTRFPEYIEARFLIPSRWSSPLMRWFHSRSRRVMVSTASLMNELRSQGFARLVLWSRGVDIHHFRPRPDFSRENFRERFGVSLRGPVQLYVGRVAVEKNLEAFLSLKNEGTKIVVGDGPQREELQRRFPQAHFLGARIGDELATIYSSADVFVFPSRTDTFGLVMLEALSSGVPVAAFPVSGPLDVLGMDGPGVLLENLDGAIERALKIPKSACRRFAEKFSWEASATQFMSHLAWRRRLQIASL